MLAAGRLIDKLGTRIGYMVVMATWSLSAMGHALANTVFEFGLARFFLGLGESGNFPAAIKTFAEWFPQKERSLATGIFNSGANVGAILAPAIVPWVTLRYGWHARTSFRCPEKVGVAGRIAECDRATRVDERRCLLHTGGVGDPLEIHRRKRRRPHERA